MVDEIRRATNGNYALGNAGFAAQAMATLGRWHQFAKSGFKRSPLDQLDVQKTFLLHLA